MRTRVIFNQKGGVGKSSITVNLAAISAHQKLKTLVIDLDPQANSSQYLLGDDATYSAAKTALEPNIENFFSDVLGTNQNKGLIGSALGSILKQRNKGGLTDYIHASPFPFLDVLPASPTLGSLEHALESKHKIYKLKDGLNLLSQQFDRVYIDTPPAFNFFTLSALIAADRVIVPFDCDIFSKRALQTLVQNILETRQDHNSDLLIEGIIVNQFDPRANLPKEVVQTLVNEGYPVYETKLSPSIIMKQSHHQSLPLIYLDPKHKLTQQYAALYQEIESR